MSIATLATVLSQARTLLNDDTNQTFSDAVLIPKAQIAFQELQTELWDAGSPILRKVSSGLAVNTGVISMIASGNMPADLLVPFFLNESAGVNGPWVPMTEVFFISQLTNQTPPQTQGSTLVWWSWIGDDIAFLGSTANRFVQIVYRRQLTTPAASGDTLGIPFAEQYLSYRTAALAGGAVGSKDSLTMLTSMADTNLGKVVVANRGKQMVKG